MRLKGLVAVLAIVVLAVACSNCCCLEILPRPMYWYNNSTDIASNITIGLDLQTTGPKPVTILDSDSDKINFSLYHCRSPSLYRSLNGTDERLYYQVWSFDNAGLAVADLYVYLPRGPNYTIIVSQGYGNQRPVVNKYTGGNLTLLVNENTNIIGDWYGNWTKYNWSLV
jgi:hypothetical protein